uniref:Uncharacterized protein n=1 Tax=Zea mays TaxID=4577 RepID=A0A804PI72_MAIZE
MNQGKSICCSVGKQNTGNTLIQRHQHESTSQIPISFSNSVSYALLKRIVQASHKLLVKTSELYFQLRCNLANEVAQEIMWFQLWTSVQCSIGPQCYSVSYIWITH